MNRAFAGVVVVVLAVGVVAPLSGASARPVAPSVVGPVADLHQTELTATHDSNLYFFGNSVAMSGDIIAVGAPGQGGVAGANQGAVYVYAKGAAGWQDAHQIAVLTASDGTTQDQFGDQIAMTSSAIVVSAPQHKVGAHANQGAAYVFVKPASGWQTATENAELTASDGAASDRLSAVAVSGDTVVAGSADHNVGSHADQGEAYVFSKPPTGWHNEGQQATLSFDGEADDHLGSGVAINGDTAYVGSPGTIFSGTDATGAVFVFTKPGSGWSNDSTPDILVASDRADGDALGQSVAVSGRTLVAGATGRHIGSNAAQGAIYVFLEPAAGWSLIGHQTAELTQKDGESQDQFGDSLAISGDSIVAGAIQHDDGAALAEGAVYLFGEPSAGWADASADVTLLAHDGKAGDQFGYSVAASAKAIVAGAISHLTPNQDGAAYVFAVPQPVVSTVGQTHPSWVVGTRTAAVNPRHHHKVGTVYSFRLNVAAQVSLRFSKHHAGHVTRKGAVKVSAKKGRTRVFFDGVIPHRKTLSPGVYTVALSATNQGGASLPHRLRFVVRAHKKH